MKFYITKHLRERFVERSNKKYSHLQYCQKNCETCQELKKTLKEFIAKYKAEIDYAILTKLKTAEEAKFLINNTTFMDSYYAKYRYDQIPHFLVHENLIFIMFQEKGRRVVVTCIPAKTHLAGRRRPKFKKEIAVEHQIT
jgi:hypothetical protein